MSNGQHDVVVAEKGPSTKKKGSKILMRQEEQFRMETEVGIAEDERPSFDVTYGGDDNKFSKFKKNPLVPIGAMATAGILVAGLLSFRSGNVVLSQQLMRARVLAQGATLGVLSLSVAKMQMGNNKSRKDSETDLNLEQIDEHAQSSGHGKN